MGKGQENLIPLNKRSKAEHRKIAANGGKASGESRRKKRDMKKAAEMLLNMPVAMSQSSIKSVMRSFGIAEEDMSYQVAIMTAMLMRAANGDVKAAGFLRDTAGENPMTKIREKELEYKKEMAKTMGYGAVEVPASDDENSDNDVVIYLPEIESEESCSVQTIRPESG